MDSSLHSRNRTLAVFALAASFWFPAVEAEVYQWRDENGKLHFSDKKPRQQEAEDISHTVEKVNVDESSAERAKLHELFKPETPEEKALKQQKAAQEARQQVKMNQRCAEAREALKILRGPVYFTREDGTTYDVSKEEQARRVAKLEADIRKHCR